MALLGIWDHFGTTDALKQRKRPPAYADDLVLLVAGAGFEPTASGL